MGSFDGALHRCPACGGGANWTSPIEADAGNGARRLLFCGECGAYLGEEREWHDLGLDQDSLEADEGNTRRWLQLYLTASAR